MTIDLSASYAKAVREALPGAVPVADRFHVVALANDMLTQVRQRVIRETEGRRGRQTDPAWAARRRLLTGRERLRPESFAKMWNSRIDTGDAGVQVLQAYTVKEELRSLLDLARTNPERHRIRTRLDSFYQQAATSDAPEALRLAATVEAWWPAGQPTPTNTVVLYPAAPAEASQQQRVSDLTIMAPSTRACGSWLYPSQLSSFNRDGHSRLRHRESRSQGVTALDRDE